MPPRKSVKGKQRVQSDQKAQPSISEHTDLFLFENLKKEDFKCDETIEQLKEAEEQEARENLIQNFIVLAFKLVGLNNFVGRLEGKAAASINEEFMKEEVESKVQQVRDFEWIFTQRKPEHDKLKENLFGFLDSLLQEAKFFLKGSPHFFREFGRILVVLQKSGIEKVRQNSLRLCKIVCELALLRIEKFKPLESTRLEKKEEAVFDGLCQFTDFIVSNSICVRILDKSEIVSQDAIEALEVLISISPKLMLSYTKLQPILKLLDAPHDGPSKALRVLADIKWDLSELHESTLKQIFESDASRQRIIFLAYSPKLDVSLHSIQLIKQAKQFFPKIFSDQEKDKIIGTMFHKYEEVRREGIDMFLEKLKMKEKEIKFSKINLDSSEENGIQSVFPFKGNEDLSAALMTKFFKEINSVDSKVYEKEELIENFVDSLGFKFGPLFDFNSILTLLVQLPNFAMKNKINDFLRLIVIVLKKTMKLLSKIQSGIKISNFYSKTQQEKLLLIRSEYFQNLLNPFNELRQVMQADATFNKYLQQLFLIIPPQDLSQNLKDSLFSPFAKAISDDIFSLLQRPNPSSNINNILSDYQDYLSVLKHLIQHTPRAYSTPFEECKEKILENLIIEPTQRLHRIIVQESNDDDKNEDIGDNYQQMLFIAYGMIQQSFRGIGVIYSEKYIQQSLELTDAIIASQHSIYSYATLVVQIEFYLSILRSGLRETYLSVDRLREYMKYRLKVFKQLWSFLREERKKRVEFHLTPTEYRKVLFKSYLSTIEGLNFLSSLSIRHLPIFIEVLNDDPLFFALCEFAAMFVKQANNQEQIYDDDIEQNQNNQQDSSPESLLAPLSGVDDILLILAPFYSLVKNNSVYSSSNFSIYLLKNLFDHENKKVVELLRKILGSIRLKGDKKTGFTPFWKAFDKVVSLLHEEKMTSNVKKFVLLASKAYFTDIDLEGSQNPKNHTRELCERQVYYLTQKLQQLVNHPEQLEILDTIGYLLTIKVKWNKNTPPEDIEEVQTLQRKYHTLFLKKIQDAALEKQQNDNDVEKVGSIISKDSKIIIYRYLRRLEQWSGVRYSVDPFGGNTEVKEEANTFPDNKEIEPNITESSHRKKQKNSSDPGEEDEELKSEGDREVKVEEDDNEEENKGEQNDEDNDGEDDENYEKDEENKEDLREKKQQRKSQRGKNQQSSVTLKEKEKEKKKKEEQDKLKQQINKKTKSSSSSSNKSSGALQKKVDPPKKNHRRQQQKSSS